MIDETESIRRKLVTFIERHEIFEWRNDETGEGCFFDATEIRAWAMEHLDEVELLTVPLTEDLRELVFSKRGIEQWKVDRLIEPYLSEPALAVLLEDGTTIHIDGNHRLARWFMAGKKTHRVIRVTFEQAKPFLVDMPKGAILG